MRWLTLAGAFTILACPNSVSAQPKKLPPGLGGHVGGGISLNHHSKRLDFSAFQGRSSVYQYGLIGPPACGNWYGYASPWVAPPPYYFGANPFFLPPPPPVIVAPPIVIQQPIFVQPIVQARADVPVEPVRVANPERFIIIQPGMPLNNAGGNAAKVDKPAKEVEFGVKPAELPLAQRRAANPLADADQRIEDGRTAFARGEYGRALEQFRQAVMIAPAESTGYFLLSQAQFAIGKYDEAVVSIKLGLELRSDWPMSRFDSRAPYKLNGAAFDFHIRNLRAALDAAPDDLRLLFLLGVELWFDDKRDEARPLFQKAARLARDPAPILTFLGK
jgi:Tetratricopeptide repeat